MSAFGKYWISSLTGISIIPTNLFIFSSLKFKSMKHFCFQYYKKSCASLFHVEQNVSCSIRSRTLYACNWGSSERLSKFSIPWRKWQFLTIFYTFVFLKRRRVFWQMRDSMYTRTSGGQYNYLIYWQFV